MNEEIKNQVSGEIKNLIEVLSLVIASLSYCYFISSKIPKGKLRLFSLLPIYLIFSLLPLHLSFVLPTGTTAFFFTWLANFKLILFAFDKGPLSSSDSDPPLTLLLFISIASLPIQISQNKHHPPHQNLQKPHKLHQNSAAKALAFAVLFFIHDYKKNVLHPKLVLLIYCCLLFLFLDVLFDLCNAMVRTILGIELQPPSDEPYLSTSLQDFWGRRWNLMVSTVLRHTVYDPVKRYLVRSEWAALSAVVAAFVVSGLMHELMYFYVLRVIPTWEVTWFFVLHGICVAVEFEVKKVLSGKFRLHWAVSRLLTVGFAMVTGVWLFFPPLVRNGTDARTIEECRALLQFFYGLSTGRTEKFIISEI